ncbi:cytochrome oxidase complex assembly protein 1-domain-containing protein [Coniochaeta sp. 2T2.1]|nr:cytochrome oxidase complex assembly protein 1-domain-containing protein [Coniochaeta sp. 2T2.1]
MLSRFAHRRASALLSRTARSTQPRRLPTQIQAPRAYHAAPKQGDGPLMERRADRELPDVEANRFRWSRTLPIFFAIIAAFSVAIFNYQKLSSPVVTSTLYSLRTSKKAREYLGDEIYFKHQIPWIGGEMNQLRGRIDITFSVKGTKAEGVMRFASNRKTPKGQFETTEWSIVTSDGRYIDLLEDADSTVGFKLEGVEEEDAGTRGFRQAMKKQ